MDMRAQDQRLPDILYSQSEDGEIVIEWNETQHCLNLVSLVDFSPVPIQKQQILLNFIETVQQINHPNLLNVCSKAENLNEINTLVLRCEAPEHISMWK